MMFYRAAILILATMLSFSAQAAESISSINKEMSVERMEEFIKSSGAPDQIIPVHLGGEVLVVWVYKGMAEGKDVAIMMGRDGFAKSVTLNGEVIASVASE